MSDVQEVEGRVNPLAIFPPKSREKVVGLTYLGYLEKQFDFCGHSFRLRTLKPSEKAAIALVVDPWKGSLAEPEVWSNAHVAISLMAIDGDTDFCSPIGPNLNDHVNRRFEYVTNEKIGLHQPTLDFLFNCYLKIEAEAFEAIKEFQDLAERSQQPSPPSADSSTEQGFSLKEINLDTQPSVTSS